MKHLFQELSFLILLEKNKYNGKHVNKVLMSISTNWSKGVILKLKRILEMGGEGARDYDTLLLWGNHCLNESMY
jgi:hypothetical protein